MLATTRFTSFRLGMLAAVFIAMLVCVLIAMRTIVSSERPTPAAATKNPNATGFTIASKPAGEKLGREHYKTNKGQLHPVIVTLKSTPAARLEEWSEIVLTIERDPSGGAAASDDPPISLDPVDTTRTDQVATQRFQTHVSDEVSVQLFAHQTDVAISPPEEKILAASPEPRIVWEVMPKTPGSKTLDVNMFASVDNGSQFIPSLRFEFPVTPTLWQWAKYYFDELGIVGQTLASLVPTLGFFAAAWPIVRRWLGLVPRGKGGKDAEILT